MNELRKCYLGGSFLAVKVVRTLNGCLLAENADYCMLVNGVVKVMSLLIMTGSALGFSFGVRAPTEMRIWCIVKGMYLLKIGSSEKMKGLEPHTTVIAGHKLRWTSDHNSTTVVL